MAKRIIIAEAHADAPKPLRGAPDGSGYRDMARSESSARELGRSAAAKAGAEVGWNRSSVEAGNDRGYPPRRSRVAKRCPSRGAKGSCIGSASNRSAGADSLRKKRMTEEEIATIAAKHRMAKFPNLALTRERLSRKAKAEPKFRFYTLFGRVVDEETIRCAWERVWKKDKAPGVDGQTFEAIERGEGGVEGFLASIRRELKAKTYRASPVRRVYIEKANGGLRPLGIPTIKDRVVQMAVKLVMEPIFEADFHDCSFGFRPNRSAQDAAERIAEKVKEGNAKVYDADLSSYFDTIPHGKLLAALEMRIADGSVLGLIRQWLKSCAREPNGVMKSPKGRGTPQGGVMSPLLSNVYEPLCASAHGAFPQQEEPAAIPTEVRGHVLRRTDALRPLPPRVGGREEGADLTGKNAYTTQDNALNRKERIHGNGKSARWKAVCGKSARTV